MKFCERNISQCILTLKEHWMTLGNQQQRSEAVVQRCSVKKVFLEISQNSQENACAKVLFLIMQSLFFNKVAGLRLTTLLQKRLAQVFSSEFCEIFKDTFFQEHLWTAALLLTLLNYYGDSHERFEVQLSTHYSLYAFWVTNTTFTVAYVLN